MKIFPTADRHLADVLRIETLAFGNGKEAELVRNLLQDPTAAPCLSLMAVRDGVPLGHILFSRVTLTGAERCVRCALLAPLAVLPEHQNAGIGLALIGEGVRRLTASGVDLVFVLGHPGYYPKAGFEPAGGLGFEAPYPIPDIHAGAWMVRALRPGVVGAVRGKVAIARALDRPEYWRE